MTVLTLLQGVAVVLARGGDEATGGCCRGGSVARKRRESGETYYKSFLQPLEGGAL